MNEDSKSPPQERRTRNGDRLLLGLTTLLVAATLAQVLNNGLAWDDLFLVKSAEGLGQWSTLKATVSAPFWENSSFVSSQTIQLWRPLTSLTIWIAAAIFGNWTPGFHLFSLLALLGAGLCFAFFIRRLLPTNRGRLIPWWIALIFVAHPISAEILCMVANMSDHLAFAFLCLQGSVLFKIYTGTKPRPIWYLLVALYGFAACCAKELGVLTALMPIFVWALRKNLEAPRIHTSLRSPWAWIASVAPAVIYLALRFAIMSSDQRQSVTPGSILPGIDIIFAGWWQALSSTIAPVPHGAAVYVDASSPLTWVPAALSWAGLIALGLWHLIGKKFPSMGTIGLFLALLLLLPSLWAVQRSGTQIIYPTRYFHLPLAGLLIAGIPFLRKRWDQGARLTLPLIVGLLVLLSFIRISEWQDDVSFCAAEVEYQPSHSNLINYTLVLIQARSFGKAEEVLHTLDQDPTEKDAYIQSRMHTARAFIAAYRDGDLDQATHHADQAVALQPTDLLCVTDLANFRAAAGHPEQSLIILRKALAAPWFADHRRTMIEAEIAKHEKRIPAL